MDHEDPVREDLGAEVLRAIADRPVSRRAFITKGSMLAAMAAVGAVGSSALLSACGSETTTTTAAETTTTAAETTTTAAGETTTTVAASTTTTAGAELVVKAIKSDPMRRFKFAAQPHIRNVPYFNACETGWNLAAKDLGVDMEINGPSGIVDTATQVSEIEGWILQKVDCIVTSAADAEALTPSINKAVEAGILVITLDSDAPNSKRQVFDLQASADALAEAQIDSLARQMGEQGEWAFIIGNLTQAEKKYEFEAMKKRAEEKYPNMKFIGIQECKDDVQKAADQAQQLIVANPNLGGIVSNSGAGLPGTCQGISAAGKSGKVKATGLAAPSSVTGFIDDGTLEEFFLWDPRHLAYRSVAIGINLLTGKDIANGSMLPIYTGKEDKVEIAPNVVNPASLDIVLGPPLKLDKSNVKEYAAFI